MGSPNIDEGRIIFESARREDMSAMSGVRMMPPHMSVFVSEIDLEKLQGWADGWLSIKTLDVPYSLLSRIGTVR